MAKGWRLEPGRHALAAKGVKTGKKNPFYPYKTNSPNELPIYTIGGKFYYRDERLGEYRNVDNPFDTKRIDDVPNEMLEKPTAERRGQSKPNVKDDDAPYFTMEKKLEKNDSDKEYIFTEGRGIMQDYERAGVNTKGAWNVKVEEYASLLKDLALQNKIPIPKGFDWKKMAEYYFDEIADVDEG
jgi:hypothetical protein